MRISIASNLVSGAYTCLELVITVVIARFITFALEAWNVKRVYDDKGKLHLTGTRLNSLTSCGLSSKKMSIVTAFVFGAVVVLSTIGGFAIVGVSREHFEPVTVKNLVTKAAPGQHVDYSKHIRFEEYLYTMSGTVWLLFQLVGCRRLSSPSEPMVYEYANDLNDLTTPLFRPETADLNQTCITTASGYKPRVALRDKAVVVQDFDAISRCEWNVAWDNIPTREVTSVGVQQQRDCQFPVEEAWCFKTDEVFCAGEVITPAGFGLSTFVVHLQSGDPPSGFILLLDDRPAIGNLKSVAVLLALGADISPASIWYMSLLTVERDATVEKYVGDRSETEVDEVLLAATLGPALLILISTGLVALVAWAKIIILPNRRTYNRFNSSLDILSLGLTATLVDGERGLRNRQGFAIGAYGMEPHVGLREEITNIGESWLREEGLNEQESLAYSSED